MKIKFQDLKTGESAFEIELLPSQEEFWNSDERFILFSGGLGCGKSLIMLMRVIYECMSQTNNYFLVGRATYQEIHDVMIKEFFEICHPSWIKSYRKTPHPTVILHTFDGGTSEIIFRNLDKMSKGELLGLNLGGFAIDQAEDIPEEIFLTLKGRLRRTTKNGEQFNHRVFMTSNPKLSWLYRAFKQDPEDNYKLIEGSTLENEEHLPEDYIKDLQNYPPTWRKQYVDGIWDESLLADNIVFAREYQERLVKNQHAPKFTKQGVDVFKEYEKGHVYQMGIDSAEGADTTEDTLRKSPKDNGVIVVWDKTADEEVACFSGKIPPRALAHKAVKIAEWYNNPLMVPEMNSMGSSLLMKLDDLGYSNIYRRKEYDRVLRKQQKKLGWRMTSSSKALLISHFEELLRLRDPKIFSEKTVAEFKTFVYTDTANKKGAGAQEGFHDDRVVATLLAAWDEGEVTPGKSVFQRNDGTIISEEELVPSITVVDGKYRPPEMPNMEKQHVSWTTL